MKAMTVAYKLHKTLPELYGSVGDSAEIDEWYTFLVLSNETKEERLQRKQSLPLNSKIRNIFTGYNLRNNNDKQNR